MIHLYNVYYFNTFADENVSKLLGKIEFCECADEISDWEWYYTIEEKTKQPRIYWCVIL